MRFLTTLEAAKRLNISAEYVRVLERSGKLHAEKTTTGQRIFREEEIERFSRERQKKQTAKAA